MRDAGMLLPSVYHAPVSNIITWKPCQLVSDGKRKNCGDVPKIEIIGFSQFSSLCIMRSIYAIIQRTKPRIIQESVLHNIIYMGPEKNVSIKRGSKQNHQ